MNGLIYQQQFPLNTVLVFPQTHVPQIGADSIIQVLRINVEESLQISSLRIPTETSG